MNGVDAAWLRHRRWSATAGSLKRSLERWRTVAFLLGIAGAFLETLSTQVPGEVTRGVTAWAGAVCLGLVPLVLARFLTPDRYRAWARARSASEGLKSEVYTCLAGAAPYDDPGTAHAVLAAKVREIDHAVDDLAKFQTAAHAEGAGPPQPLAPDAYVRERVQGQVEAFYRPRAAGYAVRASRLRSAEFALAIAATVLAAASGVWGDAVPVLGRSLTFGVWVAVLTTIGGAITAHISASRYDYLVTSYMATARRLEDLAMSWTSSPRASDDWSTFVHDCESAISTENQGWMAKWAAQ